MSRFPKRIRWILFPFLAALAGCTSEATIATPLERANGDVLTSYPDMMAFLQTLHDRTDAFTLDTIGTSGEGRSLVLLHFTGHDDEGSAASGRLRVLFYAQQHGDEPSGKEASIALARDIATGAFSDFLGPVDFYLVPQVNPDGSEAHRRTNAAGLDLNRDHLTLESPEVRALHAVFNELMPEATLDIHEYGFAGRAWVEAGLYKDFGEQIGALSNPNMAMALRTYAWNQMIPSMKGALSPRDVTLQRYLVTDGPDARFRYSTTALNDGRNSMGIYNTLSYLIEGRNGMTVEDGIRERTRQQLETMKAFLGFLSENAGEVKRLVEAERDSLTGKSVTPEVALVMDYVKDPARPSVTVGVIDIQTGAKETRTYDDFDPLVQTTLAVQRPLGYAIPADQTDVLAVLERHGIQTAPAGTPMRAVVESYRIESVTPGTKEDKEFLEVGVSTTRGDAVIPADEVIVWCDQISTNLIVALLEPQSQWGLAPLPDFGHLMEVGSRYPIRRIVGTMD